MQAEIVSGGEAKDAQETSLDGSTAGHLLTVTGSAAQLQLEHKGEAPKAGCSGGVTGRRCYYNGFGEGIQGEECNNCVVKTTCNLFSFAITEIRFFWLVP